MVVSTSSEGKGSIFFFFEKELFNERVRKEKKLKLFFGLSSCGLVFAVFYFTPLEVSPTQEGASYSD